METRLRKQVIQIAMPNKGYMNSEKIQSTGYKVPILADAYLYNGEPTNRLTGAGQLIPNIQPLESASAAEALSRQYPLKTKFAGLQSYGNAIDASARVKNPTNWAKGQY